MKLKDYQRRMQQVGVYTNAMKELKLAAPRAEYPVTRALYWQAFSSYRPVRNSAIMARLKKARKKAIRESLRWEAEETNCSLEREGGEA